MTSIFISYNRENKAVVQTLVDDIQELGHTVWFDQDISGGQAWWHRILAQVRDCDVFVFALSPEALDSTACAREYRYAADLGKSVLPILVADEVSTNLLPPILSRIHFVDYREQDRGSAFRLAKALNDLPPATPLPDPLPDPPEVPTSYLGTLTEQVATTSTLSSDEQSILVVDLKRALREPETADDARALLAKLRKRRDLFATLAEEIDETLGTTKAASEPEPPASEPPGKAPSLEASPGPQVAQSPLAKAAPAIASPSAKPTPRKRAIGAIVGAVAGILLGTFISYFSARGGVPALWTGAAGAIAGAISGTHRRVVVTALVASAIGGLVVAGFNWGDTHVVPMGTLLGAVPGAILGAILGAVRETKKAWTSH